MNVVIEKKKKKMYILILKNMYIFSKEKDWS